MNAPLTAGPQNQRLLPRYQSRPLQMSSFLHSLQEDQTMSRDDVETLSEFHDDWNSSEIVRERQLLFARLKVGSTHFCCRNQRRNVAKSWFSRHST